MSSSSYKYWLESLIPKEQLEAVVNFLGEDFSGAKATSGDAEVVFASWIVCFTLLALAVLGRMSLNGISSKEGVSKYYADESLSMRNLFELYVGFIRDLSDDIVGRKNTKVFFWFFGGLFLYILSSNLLGLLPNATSPSINMTNNVALALSVLVFFTIVGLKRQGFGFITHLFGPKLPLWLIPVSLLIFVIETAGTFLIRPASLSLRLTGNMNGDHTILGFAYSAYPYFLPLLAYGLGIFVSVIQSFVFTLLSIIYVLLSLEHDDNH
jgi:F-type H+-transporting ATPase subunit a